MDVDTAVCIDRLSSTDYNVETNRAHYNLISALEFL